ncbi:MAG: response regulator [Maricaulaceae bacterium]
MKTLIVEDNEFNRDILERRLRRRGFEVFCAVDGEDGVDKAIELRPDVILMDVNLPIMSGWDATRAIKADPASQHIPVIALTARAFKSDIEESFAAGCDAYEPKPVDFDRLLETIARVTRDRF